MRPIFHVSSRLIASRLASYQFEEGLRNAADVSGLHQRAKIQAMLMYYSCRMEAVSFYSRAIDAKYPFHWAMRFEGSRLA